MMNEKIEQVMMRLDQLYREIPLESCGYVLTAIQDIEAIVYAGDMMAGDGGYSIGTQENYDKFVAMRNYPIPNNNDKER